MTDRVFQLITAATPAPRDEEPFFNGVTQSFMIYVKGVARLLANCHLKESASGQARGRPAFIGSFCWQLWRMRVWRIVFRGKLVGVVGNPKSQDLLLRQAIGESQFARSCLAAR